VTVPARNSTSWPLVLAAIATALVVAVLSVRAPSAWLSALSPDGELNAGTASFLDALRLWMAAAAAVVLAAGMHRGVRNALAATWRQPPPPAPAIAAARPLRLALVCGAVAALLRIVLGAAADVGLGDDGARVAWLQEWLQEPHLVWTGMWLPGHLYVHALFTVILRDAVWAGIVLSALACGGTTALLAHAVARDWGRIAGVTAGILTAILPVSLAHGATPDVNPFFAFCAVAALAAAANAHRGRADRTYRHAGRDFALAALAIAWATWCRFDAIALVPGIAALFWPQRLRAVAFTVVSLLPFVAWNVADALHTGQAGHVAQVVSRDPTLVGSKLSLLFSYLGAIWQAAPLSVLLLGLAGAARALRARRGRAWLILVVLHAGILAGTTWFFQAGTQPRYFILIGAICGAYAGVGLAALISTSRRIAATGIAVTLAALIAAPFAYPVERDLWLRRDARLRRLVDSVADLRRERDVVWVAEESAYFFLCRTRIAADDYHGLPRHDSDPALALDRLHADDHAIACVQQAPLPLERWTRFTALAAADWDVRFVREQAGYAIYDLVRRTGAAKLPEENP
jgi:hypothetical protein